MTRSEEFGQLRLKFTDPIQDGIDAFEQDGLARLEDQRSRPVNHPANQMTLPFIREVLDLQQEYPRAGRFRVRGLLEKQYQLQERDEQPPSERAVGRAMALNRQIHGVTFNPCGSFTPG